jgi:putative membrane protein
MTLMVAHIVTLENAPLQVAPAAVSAALYLRRCRTLRDAGHPVPRWRQRCFLAGVLVIVVTLLSPLGAEADRLFWVHMIEHLLLADVAALLLVLGLTGPVLAPILRIGLFDRLRVLAHPLVALPLWAVSLYAWHVPALHEAAVRHDGVHAIQHLCFIVLGANVWMCLFGPLPAPKWFGTAARAAYVVGVRLTGAVLANALLFGGHPFYDVYAAGEASFGISATDDQVVAGSIMMVWESLMTIGLFCWLFLQAAREGEERQDLMDLATRRGVSLTEARAARAVSAGRGDALRERIEATDSGGSVPAFGAPAPGGDEP